MAAVQEASPATLSSPVPVHHSSTNVDPSRPRAAPQLRYSVYASMRRRVRVSLLSARCSQRIPRFAQPLWPCGRLQKYAQSAEARSGVAQYGLRAGLRFRFGSYRWAIARTYACRGDIRRWRKWRQRQQGATGMRRGMGGLVVPQS